MRFVVGVVGVGDGVNGLGVEPPLPFRLKDCKLGGPPDEEEEDVEPLLLLLPQLLALPWGSDLIVVESDGDKGIPSHENSFC